MDSVEFAGEAKKGQVPCSALATGKGLLKNAGRKKRKRKGKERRNPLNPEFVLKSLKRVLALRCSEHVRKSLKKTYFGQLQKQA